jgi:glycosyltransferase involved in cell wall biosynthesis
VREDTRVLFFTDSVTFGGAEVFLGTLLSKLDASLDLAVAGIDAGVLARLGRYRENLRTRLFPRIRAKTDPLALASTYRMLRSTPTPNILQVNLSVPSSCQYVLALATLPRPLPTVAVEHMAYPLDGRLQLKLKQFTSGRLSAHVAVGDAVARSIESLAGLSEGSIRTIHNGVDDVELEPLPRLFDPPVIGSIGRLDRQKGFDQLIRALALVPGARLVLVGDGPERASLELLAKEAGVEERVTFAGWRDGARRLLATFDVFVLPSRFEGLPLVIIEAMLARLPVVATRVGSVAEIVEDKETGLLVEPERPDQLAHALRTLVLAPQMRSSMGALGRTRASGFGADAMARRYEELYEEILH